MRPAVLALSADVVPRELYPNAVAWRTSSLASRGGGRSSGRRSALWIRGAAAAYVAVIAAMLLSLMALLAVTHRARPAAPVEVIPLGESLRIGLRFVWNEPMLLAAMTLDLFAVLFGGAVALLPAFAQLLDAGSGRARRPPRRARGRIDPDRHRHRPPRRRCAAPVRRSSRPSSVSASA